MNEKDIEQILAKDYQEMMNMKFPDELPPWIFDNFEEALFRMQQKENNYFVSSIEKMIGYNGDTEKITVYEAGFLLKMWCNVAAPCWLCSDFKTFLERKKILEPILRGYDHMLKMEEQKAQKKRGVLMNNMRKTALVDNRGQRIHS